MVYIKYKAFHEKTETIGRYVLLVNLEKSVYITQWNTWRVKAILKDTEQSVVQYNTVVDYFRRIVN